MNVNMIRLLSVLGALAALGGCMVVPVAPAPYAGGPGYYAAPVYIAPSVSFGVRGGGWGHGHGRGFR